MNKNNEEVKAVAVVFIVFVLFAATMAVANYGNTFTKVAYTIGLSFLFYKFVIQEHE